MFSKMLKLGSFPFMADDSTPISNVSSAGLILVMLVHKQHQEKDSGPLLADRRMFRWDRSRNQPAAVVGPPEKCCLQSLNGRAKRN